MMQDLPVKVILAESAYQVIASETADSLEVETGGLLVGRRVYYKNSPLIVVLHASGPGRAADRQTLQFAPDHKALQAALEKWRSHFSQYDADYVGEWHKHPPELPHPSRGDVQQARRILADSSYKLPDGYLLLPISRIDDDAMKLDMYLISRELDNYLHLPYERMPLDGLCESLNQVLSTETQNHLEPKKPSKPGRIFADHSIPVDTRRLPFAKSGTRAFTMHDYDPGKTIEGRVIKREERGETRQREPRLDVEGTESESHSGVDLLTLRLSREVERIRRLGKRYGFQVQATPDYELLTLTLEHPIPLSFDEGTLRHNHWPEDRSSGSESPVSQSPVSAPSRREESDTVPTPVSKLPIESEPDSTPTLVPEHCSNTEPNSVPPPALEHPSGTDPDSIPTPALEHPSGTDPDSIPTPVLEHPSGADSDSTPTPTIEHSSKPDRDSVPAPSREQLRQILVFLGYYPDRIHFWLETDRRSRPVPPTVQPRRGRSATVEQMVEDLLRNLSDDLKPNGPLGQLFSDLEYHTRKAIHIGAATVQSVNDLVTKLEADFNQGYVFSTELRIRPKEPGCS